MLDSSLFSQGKKFSTEQENFLPFFVGLCSNRLDVGSSKVRGRYLSLSTFRQTLPRLFPLTLILALVSLNP